MVIQPLMFLLFINGIGHNISSMIYRYVNSREDSDILQKYLGQQCEWMNKWQMSINSSKCLVMRITRKKKLMTSNYIMHRQILSYAEHHSYLGVEIVKDMSWNHHINNNTQKHTDPPTSFIETSVNVQLTPHRWTSQVWWDQS